jgi:hypothetical protein
MQNFEVKYTVGSQVKTIAIAGEHIGEALEEATRIMRRAEMGRGQIISIRDRDVQTARLQSGAEKVVYIPVA